MSFTFYEHKWSIRFWDIYLYNKINYKYWNISFYNTMVYICTCIILTESLETQLFLYTLASTRHWYEEPVTVKLRYLCSYIYVFVQKIVHEYYNQCDKVMHKLSIYNYFLTTALSKHHSTCWENVMSMIEKATNGNV